MSAGGHVLVKRGLYYRPNGNGYTGLKCEAGLYEASYADGDEWITAIPFADAPEFSPACWEETKLAHLQNQLVSKDAEIACLRGHINHMANWITRANNGVKQGPYSFEAIGEDLASLAPEGSKQ